MGLPFGEKNERLKKFLWKFFLNKIDDCGTHRRTRKRKWRFGSHFNSLGEHFLSLVIIIIFETLYFLRSCFIFVCPINISPFHKKSFHIKLMIVWIALFDNFRQNQLSICQIIEICFKVFLFYWWGFPFCKKVFLRSFSYKIDDCMGRRTRKRMQTIWIAL